MPSPPPATEVGLPTPPPHLSAPCRNKCHTPEGLEVESKEVLTPQKNHFTLNCFRVVPK